MPVVVRARASAKGLSGVTLRRRAERMLDALQMSKCELSILLTDDREIRILNRDYRGIDRATDVLSFAQTEGEELGRGNDLLGDLVLSVQTARRQARGARRPLLDEATMLLAHGLLHLLGRDHDTPARDRRMRAETDALCLACGGVPLLAAGGVDARGRSVATRKKPVDARPKARRARRRHLR